MRRDSSDSSDVLSELLSDSDDESLLELEEDDVELEELDEDRRLCFLDLRLCCLDLYFFDFLDNLGEFSTGIVSCREISSVL